MKLVALTNPIAGRGTTSERWRRVAAYLDGVDNEVVATKNRRHAVESARSAAADGAVVVAVGGDGIVRDVAGGVVASGGTMAIVPAGRGNDLAARLGVPTDDRDLATMLTTRAIRVIDVIEVNGHIVPGNVYAGVDSLAARLINRHRTMPAPLLYRGAAVAAVAKWPETQFSLRYRDRFGTTVDRQVAAHDLVVANSGRYGNGLHIVPEAELDDGYLDLMIVKHGPRRRIVSFLLAAQRGTHTRRDDVEVIPITEASISPDRDAVPFGADGDEVTSFPATIKVRPKALRVIVPASHG